MLREVEKDMGNEKKESKPTMVGEKVSVNLNTATLSQIDLLVDGGYYSNRSDFINQALRETLDRHKVDIERLVQLQSYSASGNKQWFLGIRGVSKDELEQLKAEGRKTILQGYGLLLIETDVPDELIFATIDRIQVRGRVTCSEEVKKYYGIK